MSPGHRDCISSLVGSGADVNAKDKKQYTPLHSAAAGGQSHAVKLLLELGADVSVSYDHMMSLLQCCVGWGVEGGPLEILQAVINISPIHLPTSQPHPLHTSPPRTLHTA